MRSLSTANSRMLAGLGIVILPAIAGSRITASAKEELAVYKAQSRGTELGALANFLKPSAPAPARAPVLVETPLPSELPDDERWTDEVDGNDVRTAPASRPRPRWVVSTILITDTRRVAVVNETLATVGGIVPGGGRILAIEPDHVVLAEPGGSRRVVKVANQ